MTVILYLIFLNKIEIKDKISSQIDMLTFEDNMMISAIVSAEQEEVALVRKIDPNSANVRFI